MGFISVCAICVYLIKYGYLKIKQEVYQMQRRGKHAYPQGVLAVCGTQKRWRTCGSAAEKVLVVGKSRFECVRNESSAVPKVPMAQVQQLLLRHNEGLGSAPCYK